MMKISLPFCVIFGAAAPWIGVGQSLPEVSLEAPAVLTMNSACSDWTAWMPPRTEPAIIMQAISEGYLPVENNFIIHLEANSDFSRENLYVLCLDEKSKKTTTLMGIRCVPVVGQWKNSLRYVWKLRVKVLSCLLEAGHSTILSDSDALWLKDPVHDFDLPEVRDSSIIGSRGPFPKDIESLWGTALCMGFVFFRASAGVNVVVANMERLVSEIRDDQVALNFALRDLGVVWDINNTDMGYAFSTEFGRGTIANIDEGGLNITLLPHSRYTRSCDVVPIGPNTTVAHCISTKHGSSKIAWMKEANLWLDCKEKEEEGEMKGGSTSGEGHHGG